MFTGSNNARSTLILCCVLIGLGSVTRIQSFGQIFSLGGGGGKSLSELARKKISDLHSMRNQLENNNNNKRDKTTTTTTSIFNKNKKLYHHPSSSSVDGNETWIINPSKNNNNNVKKSPPQQLEERIGFKMPSMWDSIRSVFSMKTTRDGFLARILPNSQALLKIIKMRNEMDPNLRDYLTSKYNNLLTKLTPLGDGIGIPSYVLNSMKISKNQDLHWYYIQKILETTSVTDLIQSIPDFSSSATTGSSLFFNRNRNNNNVDKNYLSEHSSSYYEPIQSRLVGDDEMLVSDQEPDATIKGHKKKYTSYGIRLANGGGRNRNNRPTKGDLASSASLAGSSSSSSSVNVLGPDRTGYEYSSYADQYGLYGHDSYDTYGKGHDDYSGGHSGGHKGGGGGGGGYGGGHGHSGGSHKGGGYGGTGKGNSGHSSSYGHSTYYSPKSYGHSGGGYSSGYGHSGGGYGGGGGHGGGGHGMNAFLDPFSILGTLAFLTYLGLLFQQSMTPIMMVNGTGRAFHGSHLDPVFGWEKRQRTPVQLTILNPPGDDDDLVGNGGDPVPDPTWTQHTRQIRSLETFFQNEDNDDELTSPGILQDTWREIVDITNINQINCRQMKLCYLVQDIGQTYLLNIFKEALEKREGDRKFLRSLYNQTDSSVGLTCGDFELSLDCNNSKIDYQDL